MEYRLSLQEVVLGKKKFAGSSMLSGALRHQSSWQISLPFGLVSQTLHPQPLHVPCFFFFVFLQWSVKWRPLSAGGLLLWTVKRTKKISPGDAFSCYGSMFVYLKVGAQAMPRNRYYILTMFYFKIFCQMTILLHNARPLKSIEEMLTAEKMWLLGDTAPEKSGIKSKKWRNKPKRWHRQLKS